MKASNEIRALGFVALVVALAGVGAGAASSARNSTAPRGGKVIAKVRIPAGTGGFAVGEGAVWATSDSGPVLTRIDPSRNAVTASIPMKLAKRCAAVPPGCGDAAAGEGAVWVTHLQDGTVSRVDPRKNRVRATIRVGLRPVAAAVTPGAVWVGNSGGPSVSRIDPATNKVVATIRLGPHSLASDRMTLTAGKRAVWVTLTTRGAVLRIDPATDKVTARIKLSSLRSGQPCGYLAARGTTVWAAGAHCASSSGYGVVTRIDAVTKKPTKIVAGFEAPIGLALGLGSLWVADLDTKTIVRVDPRTGRIVGRLRVGGLPIRLGIGFGSLWVRDDSGRVLRIRPVPTKTGGSR